MIRILMQNKSSKNVSYPSPFRSTTATSYPKEDASPGPYKVCSTKSLVEALLSFFSRTTAPLWLALGAPATTVRPRLLVILCPESRENPRERDIARHKYLTLHWRTSLFFCIFFPNLEIVSSPVLQSPVVTPIVGPVSRQPHACTARYFHLPVRSYIETT